MSLPQRNKVAEKEFQRTFVDLLHNCGWRTMHVYPLMDRNGIYRTPTTARGWLDWTAFRGPFVIACELKGFTAQGRRGDVDPDQLSWLQTWVQVPTARVWVADSWDPLWDDLVSWVRDPQNAPRRYGW